MKYFVLVLSLLIFAVQAQSTFVPQKGDFSIYSIRNDQTSRSILNRKDQISKYDKFRDIYNVSTYSLEEDGTQVPMGNQNVIGVLLKEKYISNLLQKCKELSGKIESVSVAVGVFSTCRIEKTISKNLIATQWLGERIPFGLIKERILDTSHSVEQSSLELVGFGNE